MFNRYLTLNKWSSQMLNNWLKAIWLRVKDSVVKLGLSYFMLLTRWAAYFRHLKFKCWVIVIKSYNACIKNSFEHEFCLLELSEVFGLLQPNAPVWLILNEAGLYWRAVGNSTFAIACLQRALNLAPLQYQDVPLVNLANLLIHYGLHLDATKLLLQALAINSSEVRFHVPL